MFFMRYWFYYPITKKQEVKVCYCIDYLKVRWQSMQAFDNV
jgi:hypothetical protein